MNDRLIDYKPITLRWKDFPTVLIFKDKGVTLTCTRRVSSLKGLARFMEQSLKKARKLFNRESEQDKW